MAAGRLPLLAAAAAATTVALGARVGSVAAGHPHLAAAAAFASSSSSSSRRPPPPRRSGGSGRGRGGVGGSQSAGPASSSSSPLRYFVLHKPFQVLTQFSPAAGKRTLGDVCGGRVPGDVYPVGRLDYDSEGLLLLTNDPAVNYKLLDPTTGHQREYWAQVEGLVTEDALRRLAAGGIELNLGKGKTHRTLPCEAAGLLRVQPPPLTIASSEEEEEEKEEAAAALLEPLPEGIGPRDPPIRIRRSIPTSWLRLRLTEGKNRQVRRMTAAVGCPTLRLVRWSIEALTLEGLGPGELRELSKEEAYRELKL